jgi:hypothetical protein
MKNLLLATSLVLSIPVFANELPESFIVETVEVTPSKLLLNLSKNSLSAQGFGDTAGAGGGSTPGPTTNERIEQTGKVVQVSRDMVALGEALYDLVKKGKPTNTTDYAPISVVPRDPTTKEFIDPFELEGFTMPVERNFKTKITSTLGREVVYAYGGSYNGAGKYLTSVMIVPSSVRTSFGWDFNASMKLGGMMNNGTKAQPVAGVVLNVKYQMNSWTTSFERNDTIYINGRGELKNMNIK